MNPFNLSLLINALFKSEIGAVKVCYGGRCALEVLYVFGSSVSTHAGSVWARVPGVDKPLDKAKQCRKTKTSPGPAGIIRI